MTQTQTATYQVTFTPAPQTSDSPTPHPRRPGPPPRPPKPIRFTLDLDKAQHGFLKQFALEAEVDAAKVMRALLDQLRGDRDLADRVRDEVWKP